MRHALGVLGAVLRGALGPNAVLWELAAIVSQPGAPHQAFHALRKLPARDRRELRVAPGPEEDLRHAQREAVRRQFDPVASAVDAPEVRQK